VFTLTVLFIAICGSAYGQKKKQKAPAEPTIEKRGASVPSLTALQETPQSQTKSGLRITLAPETYTAKESWTSQSRPADPPKFLGLPVTSPPAPDAVYVETTRSPELVVSPDTLLFHVHLSNQMPRVFRGSGIAVQFNVAGKVVSVDPSGFGDLTNIILPPRSEQEITIIGPKIATVPAPSTIGVFFYDVVTNMDQAGNVTEKQNFEWYFSYQTQVVEKEFSVSPPQKGWMIPK
jgi:hypothetical protein